MRAALTATRGGLEFPDAVIAELGRAAGCDRTRTLGRRAAKHRAMQLLQAERAER